MRSRACWERSAQGLCGQGREVAPLPHLSGLLLGPALPCEEAEL